VDDEEAQQSQFHVPGGSDGGHDGGSDDEEDDEDGSSADGSVDAVEERFRALEEDGAFGISRTVWILEKELIFTVGGRL
jgi:hypothetical protein